MGASAEIDQAEAVPKPSNPLGIRHLEMLLLFLCTLVAYGTRVSMSVGIVAMTSPNDHGFMVFDWDRSIQDTILSSFFWGYIILQVPAGLLAARFGGKLLLSLCFLGNGVINLLVPLAANNMGWMAVCACRIAMGLMQGVLYPSLHGLIGKWTPIAERGRLGTFVYAGAQLGTVIMLMLAGVLSASRWGWPSVYYFTAVLNLICAALWIALGSSSPGDSKLISKEERIYIERSLGSTGNSKKMATPWMKVFKSMPFWAILIAHSGQNFGFWTLLTEIPSYMNKVLGVDIKSNGMLSSLPYIAMYILSFVFSWTSDYLVNKNYISSSASRKIFNSIAFWGPAAALLALAYLPPGHLSAAVVILTFTVGLNGAHYLGFLMSHIDIAPNYASTLMGITNGVSNIFSILAPLSVSFVIKDETAASEWRNVFFISIAFYFLGNLFFLLFSTTETQSWNTPKESSSIEIGLSEKKPEEIAKDIKREV